MGGLPWCRQPSSTTWTLSNCSYSIRWKKSFHKSLEALNPPLLIASSILLSGSMFVRVCSLSAYRSVLLLLEQFFLSDNKLQKNRPKRTCDHDCTVVIFLLIYFKVAYSLILFSSLNILAVMLIWGWTCCQANLTLTGHTGCTALDLSTLVDDNHSQVWRD